GALRRSNPAFLEAGLDCFTALAMTGRDFRDANRIVARLQIRQEAHQHCPQKPGVSMKAILCSQYCGPDDLVLADLPDPVAAPGEIVIAIKAAALNFFDILMIQGKYQVKPPF